LGVDKRFLGQLSNMHAHKFKVGCISGLSMRKNLEFAIKAINNMGMMYILRFGAEDQTWIILKRLQETRT
jgi:hypothetical protein